MADRTKIEWTDATWNPFRGCSRVSDGCRNCYAERMAARFAGEGQPYHGFVKRVDGQPRWTGRVDLHGDLYAPLCWGKARRIFVNSMSDTFHEQMLFEDPALIFGVMVAAQRLRGHIFQVLTKRPHIMHARLWTPEFWAFANAVVGTLLANRGITEWQPLSLDSPPPGIWLGTSVEDQATADERISALLHTPAAVRFLSCEPLLGPITLKHEWLPLLDWVIVGGESGPGARPMHPDWVRAIRDQCAAAGVAFLFKQWGAWAPDDHGDRCIDLTGRNMPNLEPHGANGDGAVRIRRLGKTRAGRTLDGIIHNAFPEAAA